MSARVSFLIKPNWLGFLGTRTHLEPSKISPLKEPAALNPDEIEEMKKTGVITASGEIPPQYQEALRVLASCQAFARVRLTLGKGLFEYVNYFSSDKACGVTTVDEGLKIDYPAQTTEVIEGIKEFIGDSSFQGSDFEASLPLAQALTLGAALDLARRAMLKGLAEGQEDVNLEFTSEEIGRELATADGNAQWLAAVIKGIIPHHTQQEELAQSLQSLASAGYLTSSGQTYSLDRRLELIASRFLIVDKILSLRAGEEIGGDVVQVGFVCLQSGVNDLLMLDTDGETLYLETVSARKINDYLHYFLTQPHPLAGAEDRAQQVAETQTSKPVPPSFCKHCGSRLVPNAKFCGKCGKPV